MKFVNNAVIGGSVISLWLIVVMMNHVEATNERDQECELNAETTDDACLPRSPPQILRKGSFEVLDPSSFQTIENFFRDPVLDGEEDPSKLITTPKITNITDGESISLQYVQDLISPETAYKLIESCNKRSGWTSSPSSVNGSAKVKASRTSRSCPLIWPQLYLPLMNDPSKASRLSTVKDEIDLTWHLTQRIATFLGVEEEYIEPFQLVRYEPGEFYKEHHDHGSYYGAETEQRPLTLLVFLSDVPSSPEAEGGGYTKFRLLDEDNGGVAVVPRRGDAVLWKNVDDKTGTLLMDAVHEAIPPKNGGEIIKYAMNVWIAKKKIKENMDVSAYRTQ